MGWELKMVNLGLRENEQLEEANRLAADGWEPFAATYSPTSGHTSFLRRRLLSRTTTTRARPTTTTVRQPMSTPTRRARRTSSAP